MISQVKWKGEITLVSGFVGFEWGTGSCLRKITRRKEEKKETRDKYHDQSWAIEKRVIRRRDFVEARYESKLRATGKSTVLKSPSATKVKSTRSRSGYAG